MLSSREAQSIALGIAMIVVCTAPMVQLQGRPQGQSVASPQMDIIAMMSQVRNLPVEAAVQP
jgi:hypothetical protein